MKKALTLLILSVLLAASASAQRKTDNLDRGVVAVDPRSGGGLFISWRVQADEYYGVTYNLYRNGVKLNSKPLTVSNYHDTSGSSSYTYTVKAVVNGVEQAESKPAKMFTTNKYTKNGLAGQPGHLRIPMKDVVDRNGNVIYSADGTICKWNYSLNDACLADLDGDGEVEIIIKRINETDGSTSYPDGTSKELYETSNTTAYTIIEAYKLDGTRLWWIDCGPNMVSMSSVEINCVAYDWDEDGKAEVVMRGADNMIIHKADGSTYNVGNMSVNTRNDLVSHTNAQYAWTRTGAEYLLYLNGTTASPYQVMEYPLKRFESDESGKTEQQVWSPNNSNGGYGHRSSKYFFGAPVLDGRNASIFLARGIYTQTKMVALDVNKSTHQLTQRWYWKDNTVGSSWFGQGNHNFSIADVDCDGCDEIIYGSMCIDNNGKGLSTTGLGHGDAMHVGDLDPFSKGLEVFACNEENPGNNLRNATTSEIYFRTTASSDDGRALMGNFLANYPGCSGRSVSSGVISAASHSEIKDYSDAQDFLQWNQLNGRIYWDGDLLEEMMASTSGNENQPGVVYKPGNVRIMQTDGATTINSTKKNHCAQGDIIGDWREEIIMRSSDDKALLVYSTDIATQYSYPSLWYDHAYRQAMVWQPCGYNQPPHTSFFLGELEGLTKAPVPYTMSGRTEIAAGGNITSANNNQDIMLYGAGNYGVDGNNSPKNLFINVPSTVSGNGSNSNISYSYSQAQLGTGSYKGDLTGKMNLAKQGDGLLKLTAREFSYTGNTDVYAGSLYFRGTLNSPVWMNRHTTLYTSGTYHRAVTMEYGSTLYIAKDNSKSDGSAPVIEYATATVDTLNVNEGSRIVFDIDNGGNNSDVLDLKKLSIRKQDWQYGPEYLAPVLQVNSTSALAIGDYPIGTVSTVSGKLADIIIEGNFASKTNQKLTISNGTLYLSVYDDNVTSLAFTAAVQGGSNAAGTTVNQETHYLNNWGTSGWAAQAYIGFNVTIPSGKTISAATLNFTSYCGGRYDGRRVQVYLLSKEDAAAFNVNSMTLSNAKGTMISNQEDNRTESLKSIEFSSDNLVALNNATTPGSTVKVIFQLGNAAAGSTVYGYGSSSKAPTLDIELGDGPASDDNPQDMTSYIVDAGFDGASVSGSNFGAWTWEKSSGSNGPQYPYNASASNTTAAEFWNANASNLTFNLQQTISNLPAGTYKLTVDARNSYNGVAAAGNDGAAYLYATVENDEIFHSAKITPTGGSGDSDVSTYEVIFNVTEGADVTLGVKNVGAMDARWMWMDNFTLTYYGTESTLEVTSNATEIILSPTGIDSYEPGVYGTVTLNRNFKAGYSTLCVPFNTTVSEFTGNDAEAFAAYFSGAKEEGGLTTLTFTNTTEIKANQPYIIYLSKALEAPSFKDKPVYAESAKTVTAGGWSMVGNYAVGKDMEGLYGVANNASIMKGGLGSTLNGFTAYLTGSASSARIRFSNGEETVITAVDSQEPTIAAIYTVGGTRVATLQKGINLVRMSDNTIRKVFVK